MKKTTLIIISVLAVVLGLVGWFIVEIRRSPVGPPNPAIVSSAVCEVKKNDGGIYTITCEKNAMVGPLYVAQSNVDLNRYVGKKVSIQATYLPNKSNTDTVQTNMQCVASKCQPLFPDSNQKTYGVVIESIQEIND